MHPHWRLSHARGYLALGRHDEAAAELAALPPPWRDGDEALSLHAALLQAQERWIELSSITADLVQRQPGEVGWWVMHAYATRRAGSLDEAEAILREAELRHPHDAIIHFNLGCYACLRGDVEQARVRVAQAILIDKSFARHAADDPDLSALREAAGEPESG
jgi:Flp pilus assembly protein TadD